MHDWHAAALQHGIQGDEGKGGEWPSRESNCGDKKRQTQVEGEYGCLASLLSPSPRNDIVGPARRVSVPEHLNRALDPVRAYRPHAGDNQLAPMVKQALQPLRAGAVPAKGLVTVLEQLGRRARADERPVAGARARGRRVEHAREKVAAFQRVRQQQAEPFLGNLVVQPIDGLAVDTGGHAGWHGAVPRGKSPGEESVGEKGVSPGQARKGGFGLAPGGGEETHRWHDLSVPVTKQPGEGLGCRKLGCICGREQQAGGDAAEGRATGSGQEVTHKTTLGQQGCVQGSGWDQRFLLGCPSGRGNHGRRWEQVVAGLDSVAQTIPRLDAGGNLALAVGLPLPRPDFVVGGRRRVLRRGGDFAEMDEVDEVGENSLERLPELRVRHHG